MSQVRTRGREKNRLRQNREEQPWENRWERVKRNGLAVNRV